MDHETLVIFSLLQIVELWDTPTSVTDTLGEFLIGRPTETPSGMMEAIAKSSTTARWTLRLWPLLATAFSKQPGLRQWYANWKAALRRPDLFLHVGRGPYSEAELRGVVSGITSVGVGQLLRVALRPESFALDNKRHFARQAVAAGLKTVPCLSEDDIDSEQEYIVKPSASFQGAGVQQLAGRDARRFCRDPQFVVQPRMRNHRSIQRLVGEGAATSTIRVSTVRCADRSIVVGAVARMGADGSLVDNLHAGGLAAPVDLIDGRLKAAKTAAMWRDDWTGAGVERHPATGEKILGHLVPDFELAQTLCLEAHDVLAPDLFRMAWDVVVTDEGPWLLEAGCVFDGNFLTDPAHSEAIVDAMRESISRSLKTERA